MSRYLIIFVLILAACAPGKQPGNTIQRPIDPDIAIQSEQYEEEYDIIINEPGFPSWMATNADAHFEHSNDYYRQWNNQFVAYWNSRVNAGNSIFAEPINYDYTIDYGYDVNYQLYHYFQYMRARYGLDLPGRGIM